MHEAQERRGAEGDVDLSQIPGLGPVRRAALAAAGVDSLQALLAMKVAELAAVRGVGMWQARRIHEYLRQRGLLLAAGEEEVLVLRPASLAETAAVAGAMQALEAQAQAEAALEEEVETLAEAAAGAAYLSPGSPDGAAGAGREGDAEEPGAGAPRPADTGEGTEDDETDDETDEEAEEEEEEPEPRERLRARREQLPEAALALMEAIRANSVSRRLVRQITRLLIVTGEILENPDGSLSDEEFRKATRGVEAAEAILRRAADRCSFGRGEQREIADRIRRRRKELERLTKAS